MEKRQILDFTPPSQFAVVKLTDRRTVGDPKPSPTPAPNLASPSPPHTSNLASSFPPPTSLRGKPLLPNMKNPVWGNGKWEEAGKADVSGHNNKEHHNTVWESEEEGGVWEVEEAGEAWAGDGWEEGGGNQVWEEDMILLMVVDM